MNRSNKSKYAIISILTVLVMVIGSIPSVSYAEVLSGSDAVTLSREPQQTPDGLGSSSLNDLQFADPAAQIDLIQPPAANNLGSAQIEHPLSVPAGRQGLQPDLTLRYTSGGGNGWVGLGWDLAVGEVTIDTRWGVPRYNPTKETESYILDGDLLAPTAVRSTWLDRQAERVFQRRIEGDFERIQRHGNAPGAYWWEVTDKTGARRFYGGTPEGGRDTNAILADQAGHEFKWALTQIRDISNNTVTFHYVSCPSTACPGSHIGLNQVDIGKEIYLASILYTGSVAEGNVNDPAYEVRFKRASEMNEARRPDVSIDARGGFLRVTADLLRRVEVYYRGALVRAYELKYSQGAFGKTLLESVGQAGADGMVFASHTFRYYDDVRTQGDAYNGFTGFAPWSTGDDNVGSGIDLGPMGNSTASALGGVHSLGGDGRAYLGFNLFSGSKDGSAGVAFVFKGEDGKAILELIDINGDNLPDKVFEDSGQVAYRLNTSGPGGATTFGPKGYVTGISHLSEESSFEFSVGPEAYFGINVMYNHAWSWAWGKAYFIDVNSDGLADFVDNGSVSFNTLDAQGNPKFTPNSALTAVPIDSSTIDGTLLANFDDLIEQQRQQSPLQDTLRRWRAPWTGHIRIQGDVQLVAPENNGRLGDGVRVVIQHEGTELWATFVDGGDYTAKTPTGVADISVKQGDDIYFRVQSREDGASDQVDWDPQITYLGVTPQQDANGLQVYQYQASQDFTLGGRGGIVTFTPLDGKVRIEGPLVKAHKTTDDITLQILKNGVLAAQATIGADQTGSFPFTAEVDVAGPKEVAGSVVEGFQLPSDTRTAPTKGGSPAEFDIIEPPAIKDPPVDGQQQTLPGDALTLRILSDSPVDLSAFSWTPRIVYLSATQSGQPVTVIDEAGDPLFDLNAPVDIQMYPATDLTAPQATWTSPVAGSFSLSPTVYMFCWPNAVPACEMDGAVVVTVKKKINPQAAGDPPASLVAKKVLEIRNGLITNLDPSITVSFEKGAEYWFDFSVAKPGLGAAWQSAGLMIGPVSFPVARHWSYTPVDVFPQLYRGWGFAGYNGDGDRATAPIDESRLVFDEDDYPHTAPEPADPNNPYPTSTDLTAGYKNPANAKAYVYTPFAALGEDGVTEIRQWRGLKENLFGSATGASSSRLGPDSLNLPGSPGEGASAVTRQSLTQADAIAGGIGGLVGGSYAWGSSEGLLEFYDMNGDQFPDIVGSGGVQYSLPRGGREPASTIPQLSGYVSKDHSTTKTFNGGGTAAEINADSKGDSNTAQDAAKASGPRQRSVSKNGDTGSADSGEDSQTGVSLGLSGDLGWSSTNTGEDAPFSDLLETEMVDVNGDSLPDRLQVYKSGRLTVLFNLGYGFDTHEVEWPGGAVEQGKSFSYSIGPNLGFSTGNLSFSGGISLGASDEEPGVSWVDLNNDGLIDQLRLDGNRIKVRFGTGNGLSDDIDWGTWHTEDDTERIARSKSISLGGGVDFTIGIGPLCPPVGCYIIINPGGHVQGGMSRQELEVSDVNGDGYPDQMYSTSDESMQVALNTTGRTNLLQVVTTPLGGNITLDYQRQGNTVAQPFSQWVLRRVATDDGRPGDGPDIRLTTYEYSGNSFDSLERDFLGYRLVTERQRDASQAGEPILRSIERTYRNATIFDNGLIESEKLLGLDGLPFKETINEWRLVDAATNQEVDLSTAPSRVALLGLTVFPQRVKTEFRRYDNGAIAKRTWNTFAYDSLGNIIETVDVGEPDLPADDLFAQTGYTDCRASTWVSLPNTFQIRGTAGQTLRARRAEVLCENGAISKLWEDTGSGEALTEIGFDAWGNINEIIYPPNESDQRYAVTYTYDADRHTDIARIVDSFGLVGMAGYDGPTGHIASRTDANGQRTTYTYDAQGRLASITGPYEQGSGNASVSFEYYPTAAYAYAVAHHYDVFHPTDPIDTVRFLDGAGRETQTKQDSAIFRSPVQLAKDVMVVSGAAEFDALGRVVKAWYPTVEPLGTQGTYNYVTDDIAPALTSWDIDDRVVQVIAPDGSVTTTSYGFGGAEQFSATMFLTTLTDPLGNVRRSYSDVRSNVLATSADHASSTGVETLQTRYIYDPLQQLVQVVDVDGSLTTHEYDLLGRRTATTTPDGGRIEYVYDLASQMIAEVTPNLRLSAGRIHYTYDFNRIIGISYTDDTPDVRYTYGEPGAAGNSAGRIVRVKDGARVQIRAYGRLGEIIEETTTMLVHNLNASTEERLTWTTRSDFDTWGRLKTVTYPDGEVVSYAYDSGGLTAAVTGVKAGITYPYLVRQEYDEFLARRFQQSGNKVATETIYDLATRRLARQIIEAPGRRVQDITYTYDRVGNVLGAANASPSPKPPLMGGPSRQTFVYDDLYRLVSASGQYDFAPSKTRRYTYNLTYDNAGNILRKSQTDGVFNRSGGKPVVQKPTTYDLAYAYTGAQHQPTHIGRRSYTFDHNGNLTGWTSDANGQNRTVTWDAENRVNSVADQGSTTRYSYDDTGRLAIQRGPQGETAFVNRYYTVDNGSVAWKQFWSGDDLIATKRQMPEAELEHMRYFLHKDLLGSTNLVTDPSGQIFQHVEYFPGGETWVIEHSNTHRVPYLYTGGYYDEFRNLYNFGARWYEPREQFFYSPDPALVQSPQLAIRNPALLAAYSYAEANPLRLVDRDGRLADDALDAFHAFFARVEKQAERQARRQAGSGLTDAALGAVHDFYGRVEKQAARQARQQAGSGISDESVEAFHDFFASVEQKAPYKMGRGLRAFKAFATFKAQPLVQLNLTRTSAGLKLKNLKVAPFFFKQFTVKSWKP